jgi:uncharacterized delta-60 repeat protein
VARYSSAGSLDTSLGGTGVIALNQFSTFPYTTHVALQTDGKIVLNSFSDVIRLNPDGSLDTTSFGLLNPDGSHAGYVVNPGGFYPSDVELESDGKIVMAGQANAHAVVRLLRDGSPDPSFGSGGVSQLENAVGGWNSTLAIQPADGNIVMVGPGGLARFVGDMPTPAGASTLGVAYFPSALTAGLTRTFTVWADNAVVALASGYTGTVHFTSSDPLAVLPADYTFTAGDQGVHTFSATFKTAGTQSLTATDTGTGSLAASQTGIVVNAMMVSHFGINAPPSVTSGVAFSLTVTALDAYGNVATGWTGSGPSTYYNGWVHVTSSDASATLPANYPFQAADKGVHTFTGLVLRTKGKQTLTITDLNDSTIFGTISVDVV